MKIRIIIPLLLMTIAAFCSAEILSDQIVQLNKSLEQDVEHQSKALDALKKEISKNLFHAKNSEEKKDLSTKIAIELEPIKKRLISAAQSDQEKLKSPAVSILRNVKGDSSVYDALQKIVLDRSKDARQSYIVANAAYALTEMDALSAEVKDSLLDRFDSTMNDASGSYGDWAGVIGYAKIDGAVPILIKGLRREDQDWIKYSAKTLQKIGVSANEALPALQEVYQKLKNDPNSDYRVTEALDYAIQSVSGNTQSNQSPQSIPKTESTIPNQDTKKSESFSWLWIGAILLFVVIFGVYLIIRRRKSM
jgi:hypothetical protein